MLPVCDGLHVRTQPKNRRVEVRKQRSVKKKKEKQHVWIIGCLEFSRRGGTTELWLSQWNQYGKACRVPSAWFLPSLSKVRRWMTRCNCVWVVIFLNYLLRGRLIVDFKRKSPTKQNHVLKHNSNKMQQEQLFCFRLDRNSEIRRIKLLLRLNLSWTDGLRIFIGHDIVAALKKYNE